MGSLPGLRWEWSAAVSEIYRGCEQSQRKKRATDINAITRQGRQQWKRGRRKLKLRSMPGASPGKVQNTRRESTSDANHLDGALDPKVSKADRKELSPDECLGLCVFQLRYLRPIWAPEISLFVHGLELGRTVADLPRALPDSPGGSTFPEPTKPLR